MTPATEVLNKLHQMGWAADVRSASGAYVAKGEGPINLKAQAQAPTEELALIGLYNRARQLNGVHGWYTASLDPNAIAPRVSTRIARLADDRTTFAQGARKYASNHDSWWNRPLAGQLDKIEDAMRMSGVTGDPEALRRVSEHDVQATGSGLIFRAYTTDAGISPRMASCMWMLLAPASSQLALYDPIIATAMHVGSVSHWAFERALLSLRHELGHDHIPLGMYSGSVAAELQRHPNNVEHIAKHNGEIRIAVKSFARENARLVAAALTEMDQFVKPKTASLDPDDTTMFIIAADYDAELGSELRNEVRMGHWTPERLREIAERHSQNGVLTFNDGTGNGMPLDAVDWDYVGMHYEEEERLEEDEPMTLPNFVPAELGHPQSDTPQQREDLVRNARMAKLTKENEKKLKRQLRDHKYEPRKVGKWAALNTKATLKEFEDFLEDETKDKPYPYSSSYRRDAIAAFKDFKDLPEIYRTGMGVIGD